MSVLYPAGSYRLRLENKYSRHLSTSLPSSLLLLCSPDSSQRPLLALLLEPLAGGQLAEL